VNPAEPRSPLLKFAAAAMALIVLVVLGRAAGAYIQPFAQWVDGLGFWGPAAFVLGYAIAVVAFVPASLLTFFGIAHGVIYVFVAATVGSCLAFLVSRYLARSAVERKLEGKPKFSAIDRAVEAEGLKIVFLLRLTPVVPFNLLNYALGLTRIRFGSTCTPGNSRGTSRPWRETPQSPGDGATTAFSHWDWRPRSPSPWS